MTAIQDGWSRVHATVFRAAGFFGEVGDELRKSAWPTRPELIESTVVVIVSVAALGVFVGFSDLILMRLLRILL